MSNLQFGTYDAEQAEQDQQDAAAGGKNFVKLKEGRNVLRILPPPKGKRSVFRVVHQHFLEAPGVKGSLICAKAEARKPCPICAKVEELRNSQSKKDQAIADDLYARRRVFVNVIQRSDEAAGPKVLACGKKIHEALLALRNDQDAGGDWSHPIEGYDIVIARSGSGKNDTEYKVLPARGSSVLHDDESVMQEWIDTQTDLETLVRLPTAADYAKFTGGDEDDEDETPPARQMGSGSSGRVRPASGGGSAKPSTSQTRPRRTAEDDAADYDDA